MGRMPDRWRATGLALLAACLLACGSVSRNPGDDGGPGGDGAPGSGDGSTATDGSPGRDGSAGADARALPTEPPVENGQSAALVLGQPDFTAMGTGTAANRFRWAGGIATGAGKMWIDDVDNSRVLQWDQEPVTNQEPADLVIGQIDFDTADPGPTDVHLTPIGQPETDGIGDVALAGDRLVVADGHANRVLVWTPLPETSGVPAGMVLGQTTYTGSAAGTNADQLNAPSGVWSDGNILIVVDQGNHRALIWNPFPTTNGQDADVVLGQGSFTSSAAPDPPTASSMNTPTDVVFDGERLYIVDSANNRIMGWNGIPTENGAPADFFVGQNDGESNGENAGAGPQNENPVGLHLPGTIAVAHGSLFVTDRVNFRVVVHTPRPTASGEEADAVLGFADLVGTPLETEGQSFTPRGLGVYGDRLYLSDSNVTFGQARVLVYQLTNLP
jgi:hypothetical protein